jgi:hypothetical protein
MKEKSKSAHVISSIVKNIMKIMHYFCCIVVIVASICIHKKNYNNILKPEIDVNHV